MAKLPWWMGLETIGVTEKGNLNVRLHIRKWYKPILFVRALFRLITGKLVSVPNSCDGLEITDVVFD